MIPIARPLIGAAERRAVDRVLRSGQLTSGPEVAAFETEFAELVGGDRHCVAVNAGTSALHLGLLAAGIGRGDEVIVPSFSYAATANAVVLTGATPVFVDIEPDHHCVDPDAVAAAVSVRTRAVLAVHLYGHPADMDALGAVCRRHGLLLVEDAAQAHGATWDGRPVGSFGTVAAFSFHATKNMTTGEGGMIVTADGGIARAARLYRNQGTAVRDANETVGFNNRMTDIAAAIGRVQLQRLPGWNATRAAHAATLDAGLDAVPGVSTPAVAEQAAHVYHQYTIRCEDRAAVISRLQDARVGHGVYYPTPIHRLPSFGLHLDLPVTDRAAAQVLSLPCHPDLDEQDLATIVSAVTP